MPDFVFTDTVDDINTVPENWRGAYADVNGTLTLQDAFKPFATSISGLSTALGKERKKSGELAGRPDAATLIKNIFGEDLDEEGAKTKLQSFVTQLAEKGKVDPAKLRQEIEQTFVNERNQLNDRNTKMETTLQRYLVNNDALQALGELKGNSTLLLPHIVGQAKVVLDGEDYVVRVLDADGQYRGDGQGGFMGVKALVAEMKTKPEFAAAFESDKQNGGTQRQQQNLPAGQRTTQAAVRQEANANRSSVDKISAGLAKLG